MSAQSQSAHAATVSNLYYTSVAVVGQDAVERRRGFRLALESVLVKLTGDGAVATLPQLANLMRNAQVHVAQYRYVALPGVDESKTNQAQAQQADEGSESGSASVTISEPTHILEVNFAQSSLNRALNEIGLPLWGAERPETLLWLAVQETGRRYILSGGATNAVRDALNEVAEKRALPILLPLMDLQDQGTVNFTDVHGGFSGRVQDASSRYGVDTVMTGSLRQAASGWTSSWVLYRNNTLYEWQGRGSNINDVIGVGMEGLANQLASSFSIAVNYAESSILRVRVDGIDSLDDYARVLAYLSGLAVVEKVDVALVESEVSHFILSTLGGVADLRDAVTLNAVLQPSDAPVSTAQADLHFSLIP
ncbi:MAG: DUF2066 domain-containing protein [Pseudomonadota bacterium]